MNYIVNKVFDEVLLNDESIKVEKSTDFPVDINNENTLFKELVYDAEKKYTDLKEILDSKIFSDVQKIDFLNKALEDNKRNALEYINTTQPLFWQKNESSKEIVKKYFDKMNISENPSPFEMNDFLKFKIFNNYPESREIIFRYFESILNGYEQEGNWIWILNYFVKFGDYENGLVLLEKYVTEFNGSIKNLIFLNIFKQYIFSSDSEVSNHATNLFFEYLSKSKFNQWENFRLAAFLDKTRTTKLLDSWFDYYSKLDFSKIDLTNFDIYQANKVNPEFNAYISFMGFSSRLLGPLNGRKVWAEFQKRIKYWEKYENSPFMSNQLNVLKYVFHDVSISLSEKKEMLKAIKKDRRLYHDIWDRVRYLKLVEIAYPDNVINENDFQLLGLSELDTHIPDYLNDIDKEFSFKSLEKNIEEINYFARQNNYKEIKLTFEDHIEATINEFGLLLRFLQINSLLIGFDAETYNSPPIYSDLFEHNFKNVLQKNGLSDISIAHQVNLNNELFYKNEIFIKDNNNILKTTFEEEKTQWYSPQYLVKLINLILVQKNIHQRLVEIESSDQSVYLCLMEPSKIKTLLNKLKINCYALKYHDDFFYLK